MPSILLSKIHRQVKTLLPQINKKLLDNFSKPKQISYKPSRQASISIVTQLDGQIETYLKKNLTKILPQSGFIGEETPVRVKEYNWVVDPIDGTFNYAQHLSDFAVSIALWHQNQPIYSLVSFPVYQEIIYAFNRPGVFLNNRLQTQLLPASRKPLGVFSVVSSQPNISRIFGQINSVIPSPRSYGSCVLHGAFTSLGRIDATVCINQAIWDIGAVVLLVQSAGLAVQWLSPQPDLIKDNLKNYQYSLILGRPGLVKKLAAAVKL